ncbi:MAG TPA: hypothetical protein VJ777_15430 [Mycobacterium sp.]|nr:hypothetical protein [Mycobacterium sp.]
MSSENERNPAWMTWFEGGAVVLIHAVLALLLTPIAMQRSAYPDSGTALSISRKLADGDWRPLWDTQSPLLQDGTYALLLKFGWSGASGWVIAGSTLALAMLLGWITYKATGVIAAAGLPAAILLFSNAVWLQTGYVTFYAPFVVLGYAGIGLALAYQIKGAHLRYGIFGALLLAVSLHAYTTALVFLTVPAIALLCFSSRAVARRTALLYAAIAFLTLPWFAWHIMVGGLDHLYYQPLNWFTEKHLLVVNEEFWHYPSESFTAYARAMLEVGGRDILPSYLLVLAVPGLIGVRQALGNRSAVFCLTCFGAYLAVLAITRPSPFARYYFPVIPLVILVVAAGVLAVANRLTSASFQLCPPPERHNRTSGAIALVIIAVALASLVGLSSAVADARHGFVDRLHTSPGYRDITAMAPLIAASEGGVIARDSAVQPFVPDNQVYTHFLLTEEEYATFLSWPDDAEAVRVLRAHSIDWVLLRNDIRWERDYHVWLTVEYGLQPQHYARVAVSPNFELVYSGSVYTLYRLRSSSTGLSR